MLPWQREALSSAGINENSHLKSNISSPPVSQDLSASLCAPSNISLLHFTFMSRVSYYWQHIGVCHLTCRKNRLHSLIWDFVMCYNED